MAAEGMIEGGQGKQAPPLDGPAARHQDLAAGSQQMLVVNPFKALRHGGPGKKTVGVSFMTGVGKRQCPRTLI